MAFLWVSQQGDVKKKLPIFLRKTFFLSFFPFDFLIVFLAISLHEELKNTQKYFPKSDLKIAHTIKTR
jgi:hypothetical protein